MAPDPDAIPSPDSRAAAASAPCETGPPLDWDAVVRRYARLVYSIPLRFGLRRQDADDVFQATFLTAVRRSAAPPPPERLVAWLASIACWETRNLLRRRVPEPREPKEVARLRETGEAAPEVLEEAEDLQALAESLEALPRRDREILRALFLCENPASYQSLAARLGVAVGSIGTLRQRAFARLRAELLRRGF
jgi:RNA polymerase sigma factor (sigma-70 family)